MTGIYIHIPFCISKCPYCDFYSFSADETKKDSYLSAVLLSLKKKRELIKGRVDTLYFGGGTPSVFGGERIYQVISSIKRDYILTDDCEITVECNPSGVDKSLVSWLKKAGVNRISMGMQSAVDEERIILGRHSDKEGVRKAVELFRLEGIDNISLDIMLGVPGQSMESLDRSLDFLTELRVPHISAYMLKIEEGTPFYEKKNTLLLPDEDMTAEMYLHTAEVLTSAGYEHYEISNFALNGKRSRHNMRYWLCREYLGIGPSAHSFINGRRYYYERDFDAFIKGQEPVFDGEGGDSQEYIMLHLRLGQGVNFKEYEEIFHENLKEKIKDKAEKFKKAGLLETDDASVRLTREGFLLSNSIIADLIF